MLSRPLCTADMSNDQNLWAEGSAVSSDAAGGGLVTGEPDGRKTKTWLIAATYADGWGSGGIAPFPHSVPAFLGVSWKMAAEQTDLRVQAGQNLSHPNLADLTRRLARSRAYDGAENVNDA